MVPTTLAVAAMLLLVPPAAPPQTTMQLPLSVGEWTRPSSPRVIDARSIFKYMDGAGELYVAYRFDRLEVFEYASKGRDTLLVELYWMGSSDDAFGLLSGDWSGEQVTLDALPAGARRAGDVPRALYGAGLLRLWSGNLYARVLASRETPATRQAVLDLGRAIVRGRPHDAPPRLVSTLPASAGPARLRRDQLTFLRSYLVLNAAYYLSTRDILALGPATEAVLAGYALDAAARPRIGRLLVVRYPTPEAARAALAGFLQAYLPEHHQAVPPAIPAGGQVVAIESGSLGYRLAGRGLAVVFDGADETGTRALLDAAAAHLAALEK